VYKDSLNPVVTDTPDKISRPVSAVIIFNAIIITLGAFPNIQQSANWWLVWADVLCEVFFLFEIFFRIRKFTWKVYFADNWNKFDFFIVLASTPVLLTPFHSMRHFSVILMFRLARLIRIFKLLYFVPHRERLITGIGRALKASVGVFIGLMFILAIISVGATYLFGQTATEYFGNPLKSAYTIFQVFTMDGWPQVPDLLIQDTDSISWIILVRFFFIFSVVIGGILGLSMLNAVFVDQLVSDQTESLETRLNRMEQILLDIRAGELNGMSSGPFLEKIEAGSSSPKQEGKNTREENVEEIRTIRSLEAEPEFE